MFKTLFSLLFILTPYLLSARVTVKWMTVASVVIDDGKTKLLFDPAWTRPKLKHWLNLDDFMSDEALVQKILKTNHLEKIDAVFSSHSHFDHVMDAPMVSKLSGAVFYTDPSSERIAQAYKSPKIRTIPQIEGRKIRVGDFLITPLKRDHAQILHLFFFLPGMVPLRQEGLSFWDYHVGDTWFYLVEHPEGKILVDQGSKPFVDVLKKETDKIDVLIQGVANRKNDEDIVDGYAKTFSPKVFIPLHFDNFFFDFNDGEESFLPGVKLEEILGSMKKAYPQMKVSRPYYGQEIIVLEVK